MEQFNCLIIEDEPLASEILKDYIGQIPFLNLVLICEDAIYALDVLQKHKIDLIFLDLNLPKLKGFDFLKTLSHRPKVIVTTAYHDYALQGYDFDVIDYLMKPIAFSRFLMAINKLDRTNNQPALPMQASQRRFTFFNVGKKKVKVYFDEILYVESVKEYVNVIATNKSVQIKFQLSQMEELLPKNDFVRIHRSFIVALRKIDAFSATDVEINGKLLPIGRSYKELVGAVIQK